MSVGSGVGVIVGVLVGAAVGALVGVWDAIICATGVGAGALHAANGHINKALSTNNVLTVLEVI